MRTPSVLSAPVLRGIARRGRRSYINPPSQVIRPPQAWVPTPYVTETVVCGIVSTLSLDADFAGRWLAYLYAFSFRKTGLEKWIDAEPGPQMIYSRAY